MMPQTPRFGAVASFNSTRSTKSRSRRLRLSRKGAEAPVRLLSLLVVVCLCGGCAPRPDDIVLRYIQLAVALGEHDPDALDYYDGPDDWVADARSHPPSLPDIERGALDLASNPKTSGFLVLQVRALAARAQLLQGRKSSFNDEAHALFNLELHGFRRPSGLEKVRRQIDT